MKKEGFLLIRSLVVVLIIPFIAALILRETVCACDDKDGEGRVIVYLEAINTSEMTYASTYNSGFTDTLTKLHPPETDGNRNINAADLLDPQQGEAGTGTSFVQEGYRFTYTPGPGAFGSIKTYTVRADPVSPAGRYFFTDESGVIRANAKAVAGPAAERVH